MLCPRNVISIHCNLDFICKGNLEQSSQLQHILANEAAWRHLNASLHCGENKLMIKAIGEADLQLDMGIVKQLNKMYKFVELYAHNI